MKERHEWNYPLCKQIIYELLVESYAGRVDRVVAASQRDDPTPRNGEAVGFRPGEFQKGDVLGGAVVRVAGYGSRGTVCNFPGARAEGVPNGGTTTVGGWGAFNLVTVKGVS